MGRGERERERKEERNEETLDANGERSNVAGKISSGEILAAGCFCIETWPFFFFFLPIFSSRSPSPPPLPLSSFDENSRQNRHWAMWKLARTRKEASVSNLSASPLFPQISTLPSHDRSFKAKTDALQVPFVDERQTSSFHFGFFFSFFLKPVSSPFLACKWMVNVSSYERCYKDSWLVYKSIYLLIEMRYCYACLNVRVENEVDRNVGNFLCNYL